MTTLEHWMNACAMACLVAAVLAVDGARAGAQDTPQGRADEAPTRENDTPAVVFDPELVRRLQALQDTRRQSREQELTDAQSWRDNRGQRADAHRALLGQIWGGLVDSPDARAALRIHADRMARLNRMLDVAQQSGDRTPIKRIRADIASELVHHARNMQTLRAALGLQ